MSDNTTPEAVHTCAVTGEESGGKHYILRTTEGEELVSPDAILNPVRALQDIARRNGQLEVRLARLEKLLVDQAQEKPDTAAETKPAAKKTAAAKPSE